MGGGAVVLTLKDQNILSDGDLNEEQTPQTKEDEEESLVFADDDEDLYKALERTRKQALKKQEAEASGPQAIALLATSTLCSQIADDQNPEIGVTRKKIVFTEMEEFLSAIHLAEDEPPRASDEEQKDEAGGWMEVQDSGKDENPVNEDKENMDKKKSKLVGIIGNDAGNDNDNKFKDIRIERTDKFGLTCLWMLIIEQWHCFEECFIAATVQLGLGSDLVAESRLIFILICLVSKMRSERFSYASGYKLEEETSVMALYNCGVSLRQTSDPRSGFATVDKDLPGGLTPMLGNKKVSQILTTVYTGMVIMMQKGCFVHVSLGCGYIMQVVKTDMISRTIRGGFLI
ncbi:hypothetical protein NC651_009066 [Populus alba x Populus x berolinensis]|nr:hypothetical protein NC651_009066 [Populus alba x Populus x berolinensis]